MNAEKVRDLSPIGVAESLGITVERKGSRNYILCPQHKSTLGREDQKIGNCILTEYGYHCFACGEGGDIIRLVQETLGCSFPDALRYLYSYAGITDADGESRGFVLAAKDFRLLRLDKSEMEQMKVLSPALFNQKVLTHCEAMIRFYTEEFSRVDDICPTDEVKEAFVDILETSLSRLSAIKSHFSV